MDYQKKYPRPEYRINIEMSLILSLVLLIILLIVFPTYKFNSIKNKEVRINILVEDIPITKQGIYRPPPPKPAVPIPSEDESIPEDETIEETYLNFDVKPLASSGNYEGFGNSAYRPPRPISEVIPEYPKEDYKNGVTGVVKLHVKVNSSGRVVEVVVLENTTNSRRCATAAQKAAYQCRYIPGYNGSDPIVCWTTRLITFSIPR